MVRNEARPKERSGRGRFWPLRKKTLRTGERTGCFFLICPFVCVYVSQSAIILRSIDCDSYTRPISTTPGPMEVGEYSPTRGTCFSARRLVFVAVAELLWISCCVLGAADFSWSCFFFFERTRPVESMRLPCLIYLSTSTSVLLFASQIISTSRRGTRAIKAAEDVLGI